MYVDMYICMHTHYAHVCVLCKYTHTMKYTQTTGTSICKYICICLFVNIYIDITYLNCCA